MGEDGAEAGGRPDLYAATFRCDTADRESALGQARIPAVADLGDAGLQAGARKARRVQIVAREIAASRQRRSVRLTRIAQDHRSRAARRAAVQRRQLASKRTGGIYRTL